MKAFLPGAVLRQAELEFRELRDDHGRHLPLVSPAVAAGECLDPARTAHSKYGYLAGRKAAPAWALGTEIDSLQDVTHKDLFGGPEDE